MILPFTTLRRLDCTLDPTRDTVRGLAKKHEGGALDVPVRQKTGFRLYNTSEYDLVKLLADPEGLRSNRIDDISQFSANIDGFERFKCENQTSSAGWTSQAFAPWSKLCARAAPTMPTEPPGRAAFGHAATLGAWFTSSGSRGRWYFV